MKKYFKLNKNKYLVIGLTLYKTMTGRIYFIKPFVQVKDNRFDIVSCW